jgi:osmotically inducible protein OsmC
MKITRTGSAAWKGGLKDGKGTISTQSGALNAYPYGFASRFEGVKGSNPEELIGAAHASCFTMALSLILGNAGFTAEQMDTKAEVTIDQAKFTELTGMAKAGCPVSKLLKTTITLDAALV